MGYNDIHCWRSGKYQDLIDDMEQTDHLNEMIEDFVVERTAITKEELLLIREKKKDTYYSAERAKELNIIDDVLALPYSILKQGKERKSRKK